MRDERFKSAEMSGWKKEGLRKDIALDGSIQHNQYEDWLYATDDTLYEKHDYHDLVFAEDTIDSDIIVSLPNDVGTKQIDELEQIPRSDFFVSDASSWTGRIKGYSGLTNCVGPLEKPKAYDSEFDTMGMTERMFLILGNGKFAMCKRDSPRYDYLDAEWTVEAVGDLRVRLERVLYEPTGSPYATYERNTVSIEMVMKVLSGYARKEVGAMLYGISKTHFWIRPLAESADLFYRYVLE